MQDDDKDILEVALSRRYKTAAILSDKSTQTENADQTDGPVTVMDDDHEDDRHWQDGHGSSA